MAHESCKSQIAVLEMNGQSVPQRWTSHCSAWNVELSAIRRAKILASRESGCRVVHSRQVVRCHPSKRLYISSKFFFTIWDSATTLVFPHQTGWQYSDRVPHNGGVECKGVRKNHDFLPRSRFISQMMQDRAIVTMVGE